MSKKPRRKVFCPIFLNWMRLHKTLKIFPKLFFFSMKVSSKKSFSKFVLSFFSQRLFWKKLIVLFQKNFNAQFWILLSMFDDRPNPFSEERS